MKWFFNLLLLANLVDTEVNLWAQEAWMVSSNEITGSSFFKTSSSGAFGFEGQGARILLFSEVSQSGNKAGVEVVLEQPTLVASADEFKSCLRLGPFANIISAQGVAERLEGIGRMVELTAVDTRTGASDYRVVMPPLSSQQEAFRRVRELKSRGIDSFVITQGADARGISLGVFSSSKRAEAYRQSLVGRGYEVLLDALPRVSRGYWVNIGQGMFPEELRLDVEAEFFGVEGTETGCMN